MTHEEFIGAYNAARHGHHLETDETNDETTRNRAKAAKQYAIKEIMEQATEDQRKQLTLLWARGFPEVDSAL